MEEEEKAANCISDLAEFDRISALPNEIVGLILSKLILKYAIRTGVLSRRWKHMWEYTTGTLDFYFRYKHEWASENHRFVRVDKARYVSTVNNILKAHKGLTIEEFNAWYDLDIRNKVDIDGWIDFALRKEVRGLNLHFTQPHHDLGRDFKGAYKFPLLEKSNVSCLTSLNLHCVKVTAEVLNYLLSNCPFLESLCVDYLSSDSDVRLVPCPNLKYIEIENQSEYLEISSAPNLTSFVYSGSKETRLCIKNVPNLNRVSLRGRYARAIAKKSCALPCFLFQLKDLILELRALFRIPEFPKFPELNNVNELVLKCTCDDTDFYRAKYTDIFSCFSLIEACPNLCRFEMQFEHWSTEQKVHNPGKRSNINKRLKVVELKRFRGKEVLFEFYQCLLSSAPSLEKIFVDTSAVYIDEEKLETGESLKRLTQQFSPSAELVILSKIIR